MNKRVNYIGLFSVVYIFVAGCVEPYPPPDVATNVNILVVDGFINATEGSAIVKLTKAIALMEDERYPAEKGADVTISSEQGDTFTLNEQDSGYYSAYGLTVDPATTYQLRIRTGDNRDFISDYVEIKQTPPIDSITWRAEDDGITVLANTHDNSGNSRYYHWDYVETWEYFAAYPSPYTNINDEVVYRLPEDLTFTCYNTAPSTKIVVESTLRLSDDVVRDFPLTYVQSGTSKISILYSILVRQRVIDKTEYDFLQALQRVTESVGGLFDSQPYEILGNIHSQDLSVPVLGYFSAGFVDEERMFLRSVDLPKYLQKWPYHGCTLDTICLFRGPSTPYKCSSDIPNIPENSYLVGGLYAGPTLWGYTMATKGCADCRTKGGVLTKPAFWP